MNKFKEVLKIIGGIILILAFGKAIYDDPCLGSCGNAEQKDKQIE